MTRSQTFHSTRRQSGGVSLIEALVALAVMAFGLLGVVGMQSTMRTGADISRQRSEAVRIAQEEMERLRNYGVLRVSDAASGQLAFDEIVSATAASAAASDANTTFVLERLVPNAAASDAMALVRQVRVIVAWADRAASAPNQRVELSSAIAELPPEMSGLHAMRTDRSPLGQFKGRNAAIPRVHISDNGGGTSTFTPPGLGGITWKFNNASALIYEVCTAPPMSTCTPTERWLLSGFVAFATGTSAPPDPPEAERPTDSVVSLSMKVLVYPTPPNPSFEETCAVEEIDSDATPGNDRVAYYCALPTETVSGQRLWSGRVVFGTLPLSTTLTDDSSTNYKVCRYTADDRNLPPSGTLPTIPAGETVSDYNARHPYTYRDVNGPLQNKNFLVISAGGSIPSGGTGAYGCPDDAPATPIESNTWPHQPRS
ncbi:MAG: prepilin-type N-terminal cleavage/methylation domain-containing protein [Betaproteobacteria bacterium]